MYQQLYDKLAPYGQTQLLRFFNQLNAMEQAHLAAQIQALDLPELDRLIREYVLQRKPITIPEDLKPAEFFPLHPVDADQAAWYERARARGEALLKEGKVSALTVAGGQGTRLGFDGPKGTYPIAPLSHKTLFQYFAESLLRAGEKYGHPLTWYIMTSVINNQATQEFFEKHDYFGMEPKRVVFFIQGTMPAVGYDGKLLLGAKDSLSLSPDGHGGTLLALRKSGCLDRMKAERVEYLSYFQVDNPLVSVVNPLLLGLHALEDSEMSAIMLSKTGPFEKLGNFCTSHGRLWIIEYSDLPEALATSRNADGSLCFVAGSPAIHVLNRSFIERLTADGQLSLPWHRADKKVPFVNEAGLLVKPEEPNAVKLESFIFDALPLAERTMILEADRREEFAPTKNQTGVDSVESCRQMLIARDARRLMAAGVKLPLTPEGDPAVQVEISPRAVLDDEDAAAYCRSRKLTEIKQDTYLE
ncbi:UDPGP type 1 family protein [Victivallis sp. Marseille-Q1083]|uniref:UTP--glucose-1-phosphate uridylyltransferase n=1 Tax=Victivallis sp. Marseille-Q1083 TaxID=2717288 RepID=UPI00158A5553|nr:UDPGP type 1 family protein [Victivallis sp. Marseille-Q1083]